MASFSFSLTRSPLKYDRFVSSPIRGKLVTQLPQIGEILGDQLRQRSFQQASQIFGKFLVLNEDKHMFKDWLQTQCEIRGGGGGIAGVFIQPCRSGALTILSVHP